MPRLRPRDAEGHRAGDQNQRRHREPHAAVLHEVDLQPLRGLLALRAHEARVVEPSEAAQQLQSQRGHARAGREQPGVLTGDTLFAGSVGGVHAPGSTSFEDLRSSIMDRLMALDPGDHPESGARRALDASVPSGARTGFIRLWRGLDAEGDEPCTALGKDATLILWGDDYDGGHKAWVRWPDGSDDIVPGSRVERRRMGGSSSSWSGTGWSWWSGSRARASRWDASIARSRPGRKPAIRGCSPAAIARPSSRAPASWSTSC